MKPCTTRGDTVKTVSPRFFFDIVTFYPGLSHHSALFVTSSIFHPAGVFTRTAVPRK